MEYKVRRYGSFTPARRAALRKAQLASAAKRRGRGRKRKAVKYVAIGLAGVGTAAVVGTSLTRYNKARIYNKYGDPEGSSSYPLGHHLKVQHTKRSRARKTLRHGVVGAIKNQPVRTSVKGSKIKNPYVHKIDALSISRKRRIKVAYRSYRKAVK